MKTSTALRRFALVTAIIFAAVFSLAAQTPAKSVMQLNEEIENYVSAKTRELLGQGKRVDSAARADLENQRKALAAKYAGEATARGDLAKTDFYYLGLLYVTAEDNVKALEAMKKFLAQYPAEIKGSMIQSARSYGAILATRRKQMAEAEQFYLAWTKGEPFIKSQQPMLENIVAV